MHKTRPKNLMKDHRRSLLVGKMLSVSAALHIAILASLGAGETLVKVKDILSSHAVSVNIWQGDEIYLEDPTGQRASLKVGEVIWRRRYELTYYTSDYEATANAFGICCPGQLCRNVDTSSLCYLNGLERARTRSRNSMTSVGCLEADRHSVLCFNSRLLMQKGQLYGVLQNLAGMGIKTLKLHVRGPRETYEMTLDERQPRGVVNLTRVNVWGGVIPITILPAGVKQDEGGLRSYLYDGRRFYFAYSSEAGRPTVDEFKGMFGEYQIRPRDGKQFHDRRIFGECGVVEGSCDCKCDRPRPSKISYLESHKDEFKGPVNFVTNEDGSIIDEIDLSKSGWELRVILGQVYEPYRFGQDL